uniref:Uncharacterized protein n=1 Tax=Solanum tuberosum TaxID=4113 RepID=M1AV69_SOLTU
MNRVRVPFGLPLCISSSLSSILLRRSNKVEKEAKIQGKWKQKTQGKAGIHWYTDFVYMVYTEKAAIYRSKNRNSCSGSWIRLYTFGIRPYIQKNGLDSYDIHWYTTSVYKKGIEPKPQFQRIWPKRRPKFNFSLLFNYLIMIIYCLLRVDSNF